MYLQTEGDEKEKLSECIMVTSSYQNPETTSNGITLDKRQLK